MKDLLLATFLSFGSAAFANSDYVVIDMDHIDQGKPKHAGTMVLQDTPYGLLITPHLSHLDPGLKGMHIHETPNCSHHEGTPGMAAGGHYDPHRTGMHLGPYSDKGHLGDLPPLYVDEKGGTPLPVLAPRLKLKDVKGRALMIHKKGDNFADIPKKLGGSGGRAVCGVIPG